MSPNQSIAIILLLVIPCLLGCKSYSLQNSNMFDFCGLPQLLGEEVTAMKKYQEFLAFAAIVGNQTQDKYSLQELRLAARGKTVSFLPLRPTDLFAEFLPDTLVSEFVVQIAIDERGQIEEVKYIMLDVEGRPIEDPSAFIGMLNNIECLPNVELGDFEKDKFHLKDKHKNYSTTLTINNKRYRIEIMSVVWKLEE